MLREGGIILFLILHNRYLQDNKEVVNTSIKKDLEKK